MDRNRLAANLILVVTCIVIIAGTTYLYSFLIIKPFQGFDHILIFEDKIYGDESFYFQKGQVMLDSRIVKQEIDPYLHWDENAEKVTLTTKNKTIRLKTDSLTAWINSKPVEINLPAVKIENKLYIPIELLADFFKIQIRKYPELNRVVINKGEQERLLAYVKAQTGLKINPSLLSPIHQFVEKDELLYIYGETGRWYKVRTSRGVFGFVPRKLLEVKSMHHPLPQQGEEKTIIWKPEKGKINLVWDYIYKKTPDVTGRKPIKGLDVISPTWFNLKDESGNINNKADINYVKWAHTNGYKVWALFSNDFNPDITSAVLKDTNKREKVIKQLLVYSELYQLDGINIDFENVYYEDRDMLTQFVRELTPILHEQGLVVSIDVTVKSQSLNWSMCYDRKALGSIVDYIALMTYDEHWAASPVSGPVASIGWVEKGVKTILEDVSPSKVLLGLPFYTREWKESFDEKGNLTVKSKALSMNEARQTIKQNDAAVIWDEDAGCYFAMYRKGDSIYKIWLEDAKSIQLKTSLVEKYDLAGTAAWRLGYEEKEVWSVLYQTLKDKSI